MQTLVEKIWNAHTVARREDGRDLVYVDRHVIHDLHAPTAFDRLERDGRSVRRPDLTVAVTDHMVSTAHGRDERTIPDSAPFLEATRTGASRFGIRLIGLGDGAQGIVHVVSPELGIALPGVALACPDSHACTVGGLGALGLATGTTEVVHVLATQTLALKRPKQMRVVLAGALRPGVVAKDVILHLIGRYGSSAAKGFAVEYAGPVAAALSVEGRMTLCNMTTEFGGRTGIVAPDDTVFSWVEGRACAPRGAAWEEAVTRWRTLSSDEDARFDAEYTVDCSGLEPQITWGIDPAHVVSVTGRVPSPEQVPAEKRDAVRKALDYMGLAPGVPIAGVPVDRVFIGSCTNARLEDLEAAAAVVKGAKVAEGVSAAVVPGSSAVKAAAEARGLDAIFRSAGFEWRESGCSLCAGVNGEEGRPGQRIVSTTNRNFAGRQGAGVKTHLASPTMAAAAALAGHIVDARNYVRREAH